MNKIIFICDSPYTLTRNGRISSCLMKYFHKQDNLVCCASLNHDQSWFPEDEDGICWFEDNEKKIGPIYSLSSIEKHPSVILYEIVKKLKPNIIISVGDMHEIDFVYSIKKMFPNLFWMNILTAGTTPVHPKRKDVFDNIDSLITLNTDVYNYVDNYLHNNCNLVYFGPSDIFKPKEVNNKEFKVCCLAKNSNQSNIAAVLQSLNSIDIPPKLYLHTNLNDLGDYDIDHLINLYNNVEVELPEKFTSINDGIADEELISKMKSCSAIVDVSVQAASGLSLLEGVMSGLYPISSNVGVYKDLDIKKCEGINFLGHEEKKLFIINPNHLSNIIKNISFSFNTIKIKKEIKYLQKHIIDNGFQSNTFQKKIFKILKENLKESKKLLIESI